MGQRDFVVLIRVNLLKCRFLKKGLQVWEHSLGKEIMAPERNREMQSLASEYHAA